MPTLSDGAKFISAKDVTNGDTVTFLDAGEWVKSTTFTNKDGTPVNQFIMEVEYKGEERRLTLNKANRIILINAWGNVTEKWVGKQTKLNTFIALVSGKKVNVIEVEPILVEGEQIEEAQEEPPEDI